MTIKQLEARGFDRCRRAHRGVKVRCSQCEALCINGVPTHEHGCPNARHECRGCSTMIPSWQRYCDECGQ